jgi:YD repeat-containing protein
MLTRLAIKIFHSFTALFYKSERLTLRQLGPRIFTDVTDCRGWFALIRRIRENPRSLPLQPYVLRTICFIFCFGLILSSRPMFPGSVGKSAEKLRAQLTQGPPGLNLPNLNEASRMSPGVPKIAPPVSAVFASNIEPSAPAPLSMQEDNWPMALIDQRNRVGTSGEDLLSRNYNWGAPIVGLPSRAGTDLNLGLSLNSLIWTKSGTNIHFDLDKGFPSPGFRLGLPELGTAFHNTETGTGSILVTMPSGRRYEFRENPALGSNVYEEVGGTRMLLVIKPGLFNYLDTVWNLLLTDGTVCKFKIIANNPKCIEIKDRNGNYISIAYTSFERINNITDTLGRVVTFNYDGSNRLTSITQNWGNGAHTYATFAYDNVTIQTNFLGLDLVGAANGTRVSVLSRVDMPDGKIYAFEYNTYAQVRTIRCFAPNSSNPGSFPGDYILLSSVSYDLTPDERAGQTDCPRFSARTDWAKDWNDGVTTIFGGDGATWGEVTSPDGTTYKEYFGASGWQRGLPLQTETWYDGSRKKWTTLTWANDNSSVSYRLNPRVIETNVYDESNRRRTTMAYADFGAVSDIYEYDAPNTSTVLRRTHFEYLRGPAYTGSLNRRLTQLVTSQTVHDENGALQSKVTYEYDLGGEYLVHQGPPIRHDTAKYGPTFVQGRGNLNVIRRWDVSNPNDPNKSLASTIGYNTSGSVIFSRDPLNHEVRVSYTDSFSDSVNRNTLAYPTTVTDADNYSAAVQYNYDFGAETWKRDPKEAAVANTYDSIGRLDRVTNQVNGAYTRYVYAPDHLSVQSFTTVNDLSSEFYQITVVDGHGRALGMASDHPGSVGGYKAQKSEYDNMGRLKRQTNPTEIDANWVPAGDDEQAGWVWSSQTYDWQGRPTVAHNQEGTPRTISYEGCGCAGGQSVTTEDEMGRRQKAFYDILGRLSKTQTFNLDGTTVYSTAINTYNARDQVTRARAFKGAGPAHGDESCPTGLCQETVMGYDGHGRLSFRKRPEEGATGTVYTYYNDDTLRTATDARGASATFSYNARHLTSGITYSSPNESVIPNAPSVSFQYDKNGNRTVMNDGAGTVTYSYDTLGLLISETRHFSELASKNFVHAGTGQPIQTTYQIGYSYNIGRQLQRITTPTGDTIDYTRDKAGRITRVSGTPRDGVADYVSDITYRAWGAEKRYAFGYQNYSITMSHNARMQVSRINDQDKLAADYTYFADGKLKYVRAINDARLDRSFSYDHVGRVTSTRSASEALLGSNQPAQLRQDYGYDEFNHMTLREGEYWFTWPTNRFSATYTNNMASNVTDKGQAQNWQYDAEGNVISEVRKTHYFDAVGRLLKTASVNTASETAPGSSDTLCYDGDGRLASQTPILPPVPA